MGTWARCDRCGEYVADPDGTGEAGPHRCDDLRCVPVPVSLLLKVTGLSPRCDAHGLWCWNHEAEPWPCPVERLRQYLPTPSGSVSVEGQRHE